jgi:hypothetical protein
MTTKSKPVDADNTLSGRLASAFVSLFFSLPVCVAFWLLVNAHLMAIDSGWYMPVKYLLIFIGALAAFGFACPKALPAVFGRFCELVLALFNF